VSVLFRTGAIFVVALKRLFAERRLALLTVAGLTVAVGITLSVPLYADARIYGEHGVPVVMYGAGPRTIAEANAKKPDENLLLDDLRRATQVVAAAVHDLLRG